MRLPKGRLSIDVSMVLHVLLFLVVCDRRSQTTRNNLKITGTAFGIILPDLPARGYAPLRKMKGYIMSSSELCFLTATELARRIRSKDISAREVIEAHLAQLERVNPQV